MTRSRARIGLLVGALIIGGALFLAWQPDNGTHSIGDTGEMFMMIGSAVLGISIIILLQEGTGIGVE